MGKIRWMISAHKKDCGIRKFPGNLKNYLSKKADCMVSYRYNSFQVGTVNCFSSTQFYHKPVRSCSDLAKKKLDFMRTAAFRKRLKNSKYEEVS